MWLLVKYWIYVGNIYKKKFRYLLSIDFLHEISAMKHQYCRNIDVMLEIYAMKCQ